MFSLSFERLSLIIEFHCGAFNDDDKRKNRLCSSCADQTELIQFQLVVTFVSQLRVKSEARRAKMITQKEMKSLSIASRARWLLGADLSYLTATVVQDQACKFFFKVPEGSRSRLQLETVVSLLLVDVISVLLVFSVVFLLRPLIFCN